MSKVRCSVCTNETDTYCVRKNCKISVNKSRQCKMFRFDSDKVKIRTALPTVRISQADVLKNDKDFKQQKREYREVQAAQNTQHPLTGDLSRFTSSAAKTGDR